MVSGDVTGNLCCDLVHPMDIYWCWCIMDVTLIVIVLMGYLVATILGYRAMVGYHRGDDYGPVIMFLIAFFVGIVSTLGVIILLISLVVNWVANLP